jgi:hypothetical protein
LLGAVTATGLLSLAIPWLNDYMGKTIIFTGFWWGNLKVRNNMGYPGVDGRIIVRWIFRKWNVGARTRSM